MPQFRGCIRLFLLRLDINAADYQIINVEFGLAQVQRCCSQSSNIVLKCCKLQRNLLRLLTETLKLLCHCLRRCDPVGFLSAVRHHVIHELEKSLGLQIHRLYDLGIASLDIVISVLVGSRARVYQNLPVNLVEPEGRILQFLKDASDAAQSSLQPDSVHALGQIEIVRRALFICQIQVIPVVAVGKGDRLQLLKRNLTVYVNASAGHNATRIILASLYHDIVVSVLRHFKIPLDPLSGASPCLAAHIVQHSFRHAVWLGSRRRPVVFCIER